MIYTQFQRDNIVRLAVEVAKQCADRVGVETEISNSENGDVVMVFKKPAV